MVLHALPSGCTVVGILTPVDEVAEMAPLSFKESAGDGEPPSSKALGDLTAEVVTRDGDHAAA